MQVCPKCKRSSGTPPLLSPAAISRMYPHRTLRPLPAGVRRGEVKKAALSLRRSEPDLMDDLLRERVLNVPAGRMGRCIAETALNRYGSLDRERLVELVKRDFDGAAPLPQRERA